MISHEILYWTPLNFIKPMHCLYPTSPSRPVAPQRTSWIPGVVALRQQTWWGLNSSKSGSQYWLVVYLPLWKNMKVSWDDSSQYMEKQNMFQTTNQMSNRWFQPNKEEIYIYTYIWDFMEVVQVGIDQLHQGRHPSSWSHLHPSDVL